MFDFEELLAAAYKSERMMSRRLVRGAGLTEQEALIKVLTKAADGQTLRELIDTRRSARTRAAAAHVARKSRRASRPETATQKDCAETWIGGFDGSALPNPGRIGIGAWLESPHGERFEISATAGHGDSSAAEYLALIALLETALREGARKLSIQGDSRVVIDDLLAPMQAGIRSLAHHAARARALIDEIGGVRLQWIPRERNTSADELSRRAFVKLASAA